MIITRNIRNEKPRWMRCLVRMMLGLFEFSVLSMPKKSTQKEVVKAVKAESVVAKVAAVSPSKKTMEGIKSKW